MKLIRSILLTIIISLLLLPHNAFSETENTKRIFDIQNGQIEITSISYELDMKNSIAAFIGDVNVSINDTKISCQKLELYVKGSLKDSSKEDNKISIEKIVATDSVEITRTGGGRATADRAVYYADPEKIVLTGNPYFNDGNGYEGGGSKIILYPKEGRYVVEGSKDNKAKFFKTGTDEER